MITVIVLMATIPKFHSVELFLLICCTQLGIPSDMKIRVNPSSKTIGKPIAINNSIQKMFYISNLDKISIINSYLDYYYF